MAAAELCGTLQGVWAHQNGNESMCEDCRPVWAKYQKDHYDPVARRRRYERGKKKKAKGGRARAGRRESS